MWNDYCLWAIINNDLALVLGRKTNEGCLLLVQCQNHYQSRQSPIPYSSKDPISLSGLGRCSSNAAQMQHIWLHVGEVGCLAQAYSSEFKFTFTMWLLRTMRMSMKRQWLWNIVTHLLFTNVSCQTGQPGKHKAVGGTIKVKVLQKEALALSKSEAGDECNIWRSERTLCYWPYSIKASTRWRSSWSSSECSPQTELTRATGLFHKMVGIDELGLQSPLHHLAKQGQLLPTLHPSSGHLCTN